MPLPKSLSLIAGSWRSLVGLKIPFILNKSHNVIKQKYQRQSQIPYMYDEFLNMLRLVNGSLSITSLTSYYFNMEKLILYNAVKQQIHST